LIERKYVERYQNKFATTSAMMRECHLQVSGPWPPYHFVHRLTRGVHVPQQPTTPGVVPVPEAVPSLHLGAQEPAIALV